MSRRVELVLLHASSSSIPRHLQLVISCYLGPAPNMTLSETCSYGSIVLLDWMWEACCTRVSERTPWWSLTNFLCSDPHYYRYQFAESMKVAARRGDVAVVRWLLEHFRGCVVPGTAVGIAGDNGHLHILRLLRDHDGGRPDQERNDAKKRKVVTRSGAVLAQISRGNNEVCWDTHFAVNVARRCCPEVVRWLHKHFPPKSEDELEETIRAALDKDDLELAKFLLPSGRCLLDYAEFSTNPEMIEWMLDCGYLKRDTKVAVYAIRDLAGRSDNLPLMQRIADQHKLSDWLDWYDDWSAAMRKACEWGQLKTFQWLAEHPTGDRICRDVRRNEHWIDFPALALQQDPVDVAFLQFLYEHGLFVAKTPNTFFLEAIKRGQPVQVLKWLVGHLGCLERLPEYCVMDEAALSGRLEILQYFQRLQRVVITRNTLPTDAPLWCSTEAMDRAAARGHLDVVKWLHENRPEGCTVAAMDGAAINGRLEIVKWLHINRSEGCTEAAMDGAAAFGELEIVKWLHANTSAGCTARAMDHAAREGHLETLKWLHGNTSGGCTVKAINCALEFRHFRVASWLHEHFPHYVPTKLIGWCYRGRSFEELLFRQEHYGDIFTSDYLQGLKDPSREASVYEKGEAWNWVKEKYQ